MNVFKAIRERRSQRSYKNTVVDQKKIVELLELANLAPSPMTRQNRHFIIVSNQEIKQAIKEASFDQEHVVQAPILVIIVAKNDFLSPEQLISQCSKWGQIMWNVTVDNYAQSPIFVRHFSIWKSRWDIQDTAVAIQTFILAATEIGLSTCFLGGFDEEQVKSILLVPKSYQVHAIITIGYSDNQNLYPRERQNIDNLIHYNNW